MKSQKIEGSDVSEIGFDYVNNELHVVLSNKPDIKYIFKHVSETTFNDFLSAESKRRFFEKDILPFFTFKAFKDISNNV